METQNVVSNSSDQVGSNPATSDTTVTAGGATPTLTPVVAPKVSGWSCSRCCRDGNR